MQTFTRSHQLNTNENTDRNFVDSTPKKPRSRDYTSVKALLLLADYDTTKICWLSAYIVDRYNKNTFLSNQKFQILQFLAEHDTIKTDSIRYSIWCVWVENWRKNCRYTSRDTTKGFYNMTTLGHIWQNGLKPTRKHLNGKSYPRLPYLPNIATFYNHSFWSIANRLTKKHFHSHEHVKNLVDSWLSSIDVSFFQWKIQLQQKDVKK